MSLTTEILLTYGFLVGITFFFLLLTTTIGVPGAILWYYITDDVSERREVRNFFKEFTGDMFLSTLKFSLIAGAVSTLLRYLLPLLV